MSATGSIKQFAYKHILSVIYQTSVDISHIFLTGTGIAVLQFCDVTAAA
jgi:hypothetical protein